MDVQCEFGLTQKFTVFVPKNRDESRHIGFAFKSTESALCLHETDGHPA